MLNALASTLPLFAFSCSIVFYDCTPKSSSNRFHLPTISGQFHSLLSQTTPGSVIVHRRVHLGDPCFLYRSTSAYWQTSQPLASRPPASLFHSASYFVPQRTHPCSSHFQSWWIAFTTGNHSVILAEVAAQVAFTLGRVSIHHPSAFPQYCPLYDQSWSKTVAAIYCWKCCFQHLMATVFSRWPCQGSKTNYPTPVI